MIEPKFQDGIQTKSQILSLEEWIKIQLSFRNFSSENKNRPEVYLPQIIERKLNVFIMKLLK